MVTKDKTYRTLFATVLQVSLLHVYGQGFWIPDDTDEREGPILLCKDLSSQHVNYSRIHTKWLPQKQCERTVVFMVQKEAEFDILPGNKVKNGFHYKFGFFVNKIGKKKLLYHLPRSMQRWAEGHIDLAGVWRG